VSEDRELTDFERAIIQFATSDHLEELIGRMKATHLDNWEHTKPDETAKREQLWHSIDAVNRLVSEIRSVARNRDIERFNRRDLRPIKL